MAAHPRKIVLVTRLFPPQRSVGGRRMEQMARFFASQGWRVSVIAPRDGSAPDEAHAAVRESLPGVRVTYTPALENPLPRPTPVWEVRAGEGGNGAKDGRVRSLLKSLRDLMLFPDGGNLWIPLAGAAAQREVVGERNVSVLTSSPPLSAHAAGLLLKRQYGRRIRWIADFRDPWFHPGYPYDGRLVDRMLAGLARQVTRSADLILVTTEAIIETFERYAMADPGALPIRYLPNGVVAGLFDEIEAERLSTSKVVLVHLGDLHYRHRNPEPLFAALGELVTQGRVQPERVELHFFGQAGKWQGRGIADLASQYGCRGMVFEHAPVAHRRALAIMKGADALVLMAEGQPLAIPAKTYEYLAAGPPVLAFCDAGGATARLLGGIPRARLVTAQDPSGLAATVAALVSECRSGRSTPSSAARGGHELQIEWHLANSIGAFAGPA